MYKGKSTCRELKRIRKMIAEQNNIPLEDSECHYEGDCAGTCPKCDAEVRFLENALRKSKQLGKVVTLSGAALAFSACGNQAPVETQSPYTVDSADVVMQIDSTDTDTLKIPPPPDELDVVVGFVDGEEPYYDSIVPSPADEEIYEGDVDVRTLPQFPGGEEACFEYLEEHFIYPEKAKEDSITGRVIVGFVIETDGSITNVEVIHSVNKILDEEAVRVIKNMPKWIPGMQGDKPVRTLMKMPINFQME